MVKQRLDVIYPPNLPWSFEVTDRVSDIHFLDVHIVALCPLKASLLWKPTHTCSYIQWDANVRRHIRTAWVRGEFIRYIRIRVFFVLFTDCVANDLSEPCCFSITQQTSSSHKPLIGMIGISTQHSAVTLLLVVVGGMQ